MTQKEGFVKPQDHILPEKKASGSGDVPELATLQNRIQDQADHTKSLGLDILSYLWHGHAVPEVSSIAAEGFAPELYEGEARELADALLSYHGHVNAGTGEADAYGFFDFMAARGFGPLTAERLSPLFDLDIACPYDLKVALVRFSEMSRHHLRLMLLAGEIRGGVLGEGVSHDLAQRLAAAERIGSIDPPGLVTDGVIERMSSSMVLNAMDPGRRRIPTGYSELDRVLGGGLYRGGLNLVLGRPGEGKTLMMTNIAANKLREGFAEGIAVFSLEMPSEEIVSRIFRAASGHGEDLSTYLTDAQAALHGDIDSLPEAERDTARRASATWGLFTGHPLYIMDSTESEWGIDRIVSTLERMAARGTLPSLVMIDYFQLIGPPAGMDSRVPRHERLEAVATALAMFCLRHPGCAVLLLTQARRGETRSRSGGWASLPGTDDISQCDAVAHKARCIMSIARLPEPPGDGEEDDDDGGDGAVKRPGRSVRRATKAELEARRGEHPADFFLLDTPKNREGLNRTMLVKGYGGFCRLLVTGEAAERIGHAPDVLGRTDDDFYREGGNGETQA